MIRQLSDQDMDSVLSNRGNSKRGDRFIYWDGCPLLADSCSLPFTRLQGLRRYDHRTAILACGVQVVPWFEGGTVGAERCEANNLPLPFGSVLRYSMIEAIAQSDGHLDWAELAKVAARRGGDKLG